jgi:ABC-type multidrug transport system fused ATPase/permease subunit
MRCQARKTASALASGVSCASSNCATTPPPPDAQCGGLLFSLGFCLYLSPPLTLVIALGAAGYVLAARKLSKKIYHKTRAANEAGTHVVAIIMDKLRGVKTVQASAMERVMEMELDNQLWPTMRRWMDAVLEGMKLSFVTEGLSYLITAVVILGGAALVIHSEGAVKIGTLVAFMGYQGTLIGMMQALTNMYGQFMSAKTAYDQLFTVLDTPADRARPARRHDARQPPRRPGIRERQFRIRTGPPPSSTTSASACPTASRLRWSAAAAAARAPSSTC